MATWKWDNILFGQVLSLVFFYQSMVTTVEPFPILELEVADLNSTSVHFTWLGINITCVAPVDQYILQLNYTDCNTGEYTSDEWNHTDSSYIATGLVPWWDYTITVAAVNCNGCGSPGSKPFKTMGDEPAAVSNLTVLVTNSSAALLSWSFTACEHHGVMDYYLVNTTYQNETINSEVVPHEGEDYEYWVVDLQPYQTYTFLVSAVSNYSEGEAESTMGQTKMDTPGTVSELTVKETNSSAALLNWSFSLCEHHGIMEYYWVNTTCQNGTIISTEYVLYDGDDYEHWVNDLVPYQTYTFLVSAVNSHSEGEAESTMGRTKMGKPGKVACVNLYPDCSDMRVEWKEPAETNGIISHYNITWKINGKKHGSDQCSSHKEIDTDRCGYNSNGFYEYTIENPSKSSKHITVQVAASTEAGTGELEQNKTHTKDCRGLGWKIPFGIFQCVTLTLCVILITVLCYMKRGKSGHQRPPLPSLTELSCHPEGAPDHKYEDIARESQRSDGRRYEAMQEDDTTVILENPSKEGGISNVSYTDPGAYEDIKEETPVNLLHSLSPNTTAQASVVVPYPSNSQAVQESNQQPILNTNTTRNGETPADFGYNLEKPISFSDANEEDELFDRGSTMPKGLAPIPFAKTVTNKNTQGKNHLNKDVSQSNQGKGVMQELQNKGVNHQGNKETQPNYENVRIKPKVAVKPSKKPQMSEQGGQNNASLQYQNDSKVHMPVTEEEDSALHYQNVS